MSNFLNYGIAPGKDEKLAEALKTIEDFANAYISANPDAATAIVVGVLRSIDNMGGFNFKSSAIVGSKCPYDPDKFADDLLGLIPSGMDDVSHN